MPCPRPLLAHSRGLVPPDGAGASSLGDARPTGDVWRVHLALVGQTLVALVVGVAPAVVLVFVLLALV
jgi:hypothetical protein